MSSDLVEKSADILNQSWHEVCCAIQRGEPGSFIRDDKLREAIHEAINSKSKTFRYVLPTQVLAKLADSTLNCRCLQTSRGGQGAFDARTIAHEVVVPFDQQNNSVLGGSPEPYVNNPLRVPEVSSRHARDKKNQKDWLHLCTVLDAIEGRNDQEFTSLVFQQVFAEIYRRLASVRVVYSAPLRISLIGVLEIIEQFLSSHSGGDRLLALTSALFEVIGERFGLYDKLRRANITSADAATGMLADLECLSGSEIVMVVEVKDRELTINQVMSKIPNIREKKVSEIFFVAQQGIAIEDSPAIKDLIRHEFISGHNVYITDLIFLARTVLALLGERGRRDFLAKVGKQLDGYGSEIHHRRAWAEFLGRI